MEEERRRGERRGQPTDATLFFLQVKKAVGASSGSSVRSSKEQRDNTTWRMVNLFVVK